MHNNQLLSLVNSQFRSLSSSSSKIAEMMKRLNEFGEPVLIGGAVRDIILGADPKDYDLIINTKRPLTLDEYSTSRNSFGGYKVDLDGCIFDIWDITSHWPFRTKLMQPTVGNISKSAFYNLDAIYINLTTGEFDREFFDQAISTKILDISLPDGYIAYSAYADYLIVKAFKAREKYNLKFSENVRFFMSDWVASSDNPYEILAAVELKRYGSKEFDYKRLMQQL